MTTATASLPLPQAAAARASDAALLAPSPADFLLPALATGLQVPRALLLRSHMWFTGKPFAAAALHGAWEVPQPPCWQDGQPGQQMNGTASSASIVSVVCLPACLPFSSAGTSWATLFACLQAAVVAAAGGGLAEAAVALAAPAVAAACLLRGFSVVHGGSAAAPLQALQPIVDAYREEQQPWRKLFSLLGRQALAARCRLRGTVRLARSSLHPPL